MRAALFATVAVTGCQGAAQAQLDAWEPLLYKTECGLYTPRTRADLPPPIAWEPCGDDLPCRKIAITWEPDPAIDEQIAPNTLATRDSAGRVLLHTARFTRDRTLRLVAEADGAVRVAIREQRRDRCVLAPAPGDGDRWAMRVYDSEATGAIGSYGGGAIAGSLDDLHPQLVVASHDRLGRSIAAGAPGLLELAGGSLQLHPWRGAASELWSAQRAGGLAQHFAAFHGDALTWSSDNVARQELMMWTASDGVQPLLGFGDDWSRGVADLGSDGHDLVWLEGSGRTRADEPYPDVAIVASRYTTDRARLEHRIVRSGLAAEPFGTEPFVVGCGHAARTSTIGTARGTLVVRIADGRTWLLPSDGDRLWRWSTPLAITCDEVFLRARDHGRATIARVRLDALTPFVM